MYNKTQLEFFHCFINQNQCSIIGTISRNNQFLNHFIPRHMPVHALPFFHARSYHILIELISKRSEEVIKSFNIRTTPWGHISENLSLSELKDHDILVRVYDITHHSIHHFLGDYSPTQAGSPMKVVISDFDKTVIKTKYSSLKEVFTSLTSRLNRYEPIEHSLEAIRNKQREGAHVYFLSASPHFYLGQIKKWLKLKQIKPEAILLKDYRQILSFKDRGLTLRNIKEQGTYKLLHLLNLITLIGIPDELTLWGDNHEIDPLTYIMFANILCSKSNPWDTWKEISQLKGFKQNSHQAVTLLNYFFEVRNQLKNNKVSTRITINIIGKPQNLPKIKAFLKHKNTQINFSD